MSEQTYTVEAPGGGTLMLLSAEEVSLYEEMAESYKKDYALTRQSELVLLGALLSQVLELHRAQQQIAGLIAERDANGVATGEYEYKPLKPSDRADVQKIITAASKEIRELEKQLGIDKKTRDAGNRESVADYMTMLKRAGHRMGVHIFERVKKYEAFNNELKWRLRLLKNGDPEDKKYQGISAEKICDWARGELQEIEAFDKEFAKEQARLFGGKL